MSKIWIFGDSYGADYSNRYYSDDKKAITEHQWHLLLSKSLNTEVVNLSMSGCGLDWIMRAWHDNRDLIEKGDSVVIIVTNTERRWLFEDKPYITIIPNILNGLAQEVSKKQVKAVRYYAEHLHHAGSVAVNFKNWLYNIADLINTRGCKVLFIPAFNCSRDLLRETAFDSMYVAKGCLSIASFNEYSASIRKNMINVLDGRCGHLSPANHYVLAKKIEDFLVNDVPVDLNDGFCQEFITEKNFHSPEFYLFEHKMIYK